MVKANRQHRKPISSLASAPVQRVSRQEYSFPAVSHYGMPASIHGIANRSAQVQQAMQMKHMMNQAAPIQRKTYYDPKTGKYVRYKKDESGAYKQLGEAKSAKEGEQDYKMQALNLLSRKMETKLNEDGKDVGPHIAVSVQGGRLYIGINTSWKRAKGKPAASATDEDLKLAAETLIEDLFKTDDKTSEDPAEKAQLEAANWIYRAKGNIFVFGAVDGGGKKAGRAQHGEMRIMHHLLNKSAEEGGLKEGSKEGKPPSKEDGLLKVVRVGGLQTDCQTCHWMHHGASTGEESYDADQSPVEGVDSHDKQLSEKGMGYRVLTPGTHKTDYSAAWLYPGTEEKAEVEHYPKTKDYKARKTGSKTLSDKSGNMEKKLEELTKK